MRAFAALDEMHTRRRAWREQARAYRRMIKRLPADHPLLPDLWHALGEVYRSRLRQYQEAAAAFEVARSLSPDNLDRRAILAELYQLTSDSPTTAAEEHHAVLARDPGRVDSYRALKDIYARAGRMDQAWCACRALVFLERATPAEIELYRRYRSRSIAEFKAPITPEMRSRLVHPDESGLIALALGVVRAEAAIARPSELRIRVRQRIEPRRHRLPRFRMLAHIAAALDRPLPEVYEQTGRIGTLAFGLCLIQDALWPVLAPRAEFLKLGDKGAAYAAGRALFLLDPDRVLVALFNEEELRSIVRWILGQPDSGAMRALLDRSVASRLRPDQREQILQARKSLAEGDWQSEFERWLRAVVITSDRAGFLVSGGLKATARRIAALRGSPAGLTPAARILEILRYSVTDEHAAIRRHLCGRI
jgi:tetratricopeptide (TPR) repeat protein